MLPIYHRRCCLIAATSAQFPVEFDNLAQAVLQLCQYSFNIPERCWAQQKWPHAGAALMFGAALWFDWFFRATSLESPGYTGSDGSQIRHLLLHDR